MWPISVDSMSTVELTHMYPGGIGFVAHPREFSETKGSQTIKVVPSVCQFLLSLLSITSSWSEV